MTSFAETLQSVSTIDGWLTEGQARMLYDAASAAPAGEAIVEIASHHGRSTIILAKAKSPSVQLIAIDPFGDPRWGGGNDALDTFNENLAQNGLGDAVTLIRDFGANAGDNWSSGPVGLLFVDGAHDYPSVKTDLAAWRPHLSPTATILLHDAYSSPGVTRAVFAEMFASRDYRYTGSSGSLVRFQRSPSPSTVGVMIGRGRMLAKLPYLARNLAIKVAMRRGWDALPPLLGHRSPGAPY